VRDQRSLFSMVLGSEPQCQFMFDMEKSDSAQPLTVGAFSIGEYGKIAILSASILVYRPTTQAPKHTKL